GQVAGATTVVPEGPVRVALAAVHVGPGGRVHDQVGGELGERFGHRRPAGDVEARMVEGDQLLGVGERGLQGPADLPPRPRQQNPHLPWSRVRGAPAGFIGRHQSSWDRYQAIVSARPWSKSWAGAQPSSRTRVVSSENAPCVPWARAGTP